MNFLKVCSRLSRLPSVSVRTFAASASKSGNLSSEDIGRDSKSGVKTSSEQKGSTPGTGSGVGEGAGIKLGTQPDQTSRAGGKAGLHDPTTAGGAGEGPTASKGGRYANK